MFSWQPRFACIPLLVSASFLSGCGKSLPSIAQSGVKAQAFEDPAPTDVPRSRDADDAGRFVAGLPGKPGSVFSALENTDEWREHRRLLDEAWKEADTKLISGLRDFQQHELSGTALGESTVFYPFGGPDALTPVLCFPQANVYVLVGLEPAGTLPKPAQIEKKDFSPYLAGLRDTVDSELSRSFFITRQMDHQLRGQITDGLLIPILHLLVRTNHSILGLRYVRLDNEGRVIDRASNYKAPGRIGNKGVEIEFRADSEPSSHKLYYFSVNLSNQRLKENKPFLDYAASLKGSTTLLKATSYMTHKSAFSIIRDRILANSSAVLQDDSGIPYRYFKQAPGWNVQLYGDYQRPYGSFRWLEQPDLRKAFQSGAKPLSMRLGYGFSKVESNLLLARRADH